MMFLNSLFPSSYIHVSVTVMHLAITGMADNCIHRRRFKTPSYKRLQTGM